MSESIYRNHAIHSTIKQLLDFQSDDELSNARLGLGEDQAWQIDRVFEVTRTVEGYLRNTPSTLTSITSLNNISSHLQQAYAELSGFKSTKNSAHITNANSHIENTILQLYGFACIPARLNEGGIENLIGDLRHRTHEAIKALQIEKDSLANQVVLLKSQLSVSEQKVEELTTAVSVQKKEAIAVTAEVRTEYSKTESELRTVFNDSLDDFIKRFNGFDAETKKSTDEIISDLLKKQEEAKKIVQIVGNIGVTGNYQNNAEKEGRLADRMRNFTIAIFITGVVIAIAVLLSHLFPALLGVQVKPEGPWDLVLRLLTAMVITAPALYTAKESARHRTNSDRAKQRELELASLGPFIELLPTDKKEEIIHKMTDRYFGTQVEAHESKPLVDPKDAIDLAKHAVDGLVKVAK